MKIEAKKVIDVHAEVSCNGREYKVTTCGDVYVWDFDHTCAEGNWIWQSDYDDNYDEVKAAGLAVMGE